MFGGLRLDTRSSIVRARCLSTALLVALTVPIHAAPDAPAAGTWQSAPDETPLSAAYQEDVWGKNAKEVRTVQMVVRAAGDATLTVTRRVVDGRGRTVAGSTSIEEAQMTIGAGKPGAGVRTDLDVAVRRAERRYPGEPGSTWPLEGLRVTVTTFADDARKLEVRVDYPEGRGSFWDALRRQPRRPPT